MQHVPCTKYVVIGRLLHKELQDNQKINRTIISANENGRVNIYYTDGTFILECDTTGDHDPNDYYFFTNAEENEIFDVLTKLHQIIGENNIETIKKATASTLDFLKQ